MMDPPEHTRYRKLVTRSFGARAVAALRTRVEEIAEELLDEIAGSIPAGGGTVDLVERYASLLPATVIAEMLGAPVAMRRQFLDWGAGASLSLDIGLSYRDFRRSEADLAALHRWMLSHFTEIRRARHNGNARDDILSALVTAHDEGGQLSTDELSKYCHAAARGRLRNHGQPAGQRHRPAAAGAGGCTDSPAARGRQPRSRAVPQPTRVRRPTGRGR
ncbi:MAG: hypothetical protein ACRDSP_03945 [Pseudonocardiaceae bacterium]